MTRPRHDRRPISSERDRPARLLVTGSREWTDETLIRRHLVDLMRRHGRDAILIVGKARGVDTIAENIWVEMGGEVDPHPANWRPNGVFDRSAGYRRNAEMVASGVDEWVAFSLNNSGGTANTIGLCEKIPGTAYYLTLKVEQQGGRQE